MSKAENSSKKSKQSKTNSNLDDWLKTYSTQKPKSQPNETSEEQSIYFKDTKYSEISDKHFQPLGDSIDETSGTGVECKTEQIFDKEFDKQLEQWFDYNEDFQVFDGKTNQSIDTLESVVVKREIEDSMGVEGDDSTERFSMSQWSLFMPTSQVKGKTFFTQN